MAKSSTLTTLEGKIARDFRGLQHFLKAIKAFFQKISQFMLRCTGMFICLGGLSATIGWLLSSSRPDPLGPTWNLGVWLVIIGVFAVVLGILSLATRYVLRIGMIGQYGIIIFLVGAMVLMAGAFAVNLFILPWMAKLFSEFPNLGSVLQGGYNTVQNGINSTTTSAVNTGSNICNIVTNPFGGSNSCSTSTSTSPVPNQTVPSLSVDDLLSKIGLPSIGTLGTLGLIFLSGAPLAPGCLVVGIVFLLAGVRPRSALLLLIGAAFLNLGGQFVLHVTFLGPILGVLLFLALAWLGFTLWVPWKFSLAGVFSRLQGRKA